MIVLNALLAVLVHELAHIAMARVLGVTVYAVGMSWRGPYVRRESGTEGQNMAITLAGPGVNLVLAILMCRANPASAINNLTLGLFNLLPIPGSDGSRAYSIVAGMRRKAMPRPPHLSSRSEVEGLTIPSNDRDRAA
jgi:Zn-dependent protease